MQYFSSDRPSSLIRCLLVSLQFLLTAHACLAITRITESLKDEDVLANLLSDDNFGTEYIAILPLFLEPPTIRLDDGTYLRIIDRAITGGYIASFNTTDKNCVKPGDHFVVTARRYSLKDHRLVIMLKLSRRGTDGTAPADKFFYRCDIRVTADTKFYNSQTIMDGLISHFHSDALRRRRENYAR